MKIKIHWRISNIEHIAKHGDIPYLYCIGNTGERYLFIVLKYSTYYKKYMIKSAREATEKEKKLYKRKR